MCFVCIKDQPDHHSRTEILFPRDTRRSFMILMLSRASIGHLKFVLDDIMCICILLIFFFKFEPRKKLLGYDYLVILMTISTILVMVLRAIFQEIEKCSMVRKLLLDFKPCDISRRFPNLNKYSAEFIQNDLFLPQPRYS